MTCGRPGCGAEAAYDWRDALVAWQVCTDCAADLLSQLTDTEVAEFVGPTRVEAIPA